MAGTKARRVVFVRSGSEISQELAHALEVAPRGGVVVPGSAPAATKDQLLTAAIVTPGTAVPRRAALNALLTKPSQDPAVLRALAMASGTSKVRALEAGAATEPCGDVSVLTRVADLAERYVALARPHARSGAVQSAIDSARAQVAAEIGELLRAEPDARAEALPHLRAARDAGLDMRVVNGVSARTLAVSYAFPPFLDTSGFVTARRFAIAGRPYDVVTQDMTGHRPMDERSLALADDELGELLFVKGRAAFGSWVTIEKFCRKGMSLIEDVERRKGPYEELYSRSMWAASTVLGAWYKARHPHTPWTAELSDPLVQRPNGERRENPFPDNDILQEIEAAAQRLGRQGFEGEGFFEAVEWMAYALADEIIFTNENQRDFMLADFYDSQLAERARSISTVSHHPVPPASLYEVSEPVDDLPSGVVTIAYFGRFYAVRGVGDILDPFAELDESERDRLRLLIFTTDIEETRAAVADHPAGGCVEVRPALPYFEFLATAKAVDWLIVADAHRPPDFALNPYLPSKLADYVGSGTPVWALAEPGSVLSGEKVAATSPLGDVAAAAEVLRSRILAPNSPA